MFLRLRASNNYLKAQLKIFVMELKIAPSILSADFGRLNEEIASVEKFSDIIHVDVMDGHFVPNITIGAPVVKSLKTKLPLDVHLMIENPGKFIPSFAQAIKDSGADVSGSRIVVHVEASSDLRGLLGAIRELGLKAGVSVKPKTDVSEIEEYLDMIDYVLIMTVEPGFGGQKFMNDMVLKIKKLRGLGFKGDIGVDGGINEETGRICKEAGANVLIAGSYIFGAKDRGEMVNGLRG